MRQADPSTTEQTAQDESRTTREAALLLLRSPKWSVSQVMELLEIGDQEFRALVDTDGRLAKLLDARREDAQYSGLVERQCKNCGDFFTTATYRSYCDDAHCRRVEQIDQG